MDLLRCPACRSQELAETDQEITCRACTGRYPVRFGIPAMVLPGSPLYASLQTPAARPPLVGSATDAERQRDYWESDLGHREPTHPVVRGFARQRWEYVESLINLSEVRTALDVGAGNGFATQHLPAHVRAVATDGSWHMLRRHPGVERILADAQTLPFPDRSFELVFCWELLHHVDEPWRVLAEMARVTSRFVVLFEPNRLNPAQAAFALADPEHRWVLRFSRRYLLDQLRRAGLQSSAFRRVGCIFPNKTPEWLYPLLRVVPFRVPYMGISQLVVAERRD